MSHKQNRKFVHIALIFSLDCLRSPLLTTPKVHVTAVDHMSAPICSCTHSHCTCKQSQCILFWKWSRCVAQLHLMSFMLVSHETREASAGKMQNLTLSLALCSPQPFCWCVVVYIWESNTGMCFLHWWNLGRTTPEELWVFRNVATTTRSSLTFALTSYFSSRKHIQDGLFRER